MRITRPRYFQHPKIFPRARRIHQRRLQWQSGRRRQEERQSGKIHLPVQGSILRTFCAHRALRCTHRELPLHYLVPRPNKFTTGVAIAVGLVNLVSARSSPGTSKSQNIFRYWCPLDPWNLKITEHLSRYWCPLDPWNLKITEHLSRYYNYSKNKFCLFPP